MISDDAEARGLALSQELELPPPSPGPRRRRHPHQAGLPRRAQEARAKDHASVTLGHSTG